MSRRVITAIPTSTRGSGQNENVAVEVAPVPAPDDFLGRLIKYIPAEIVGLFVAVRGVIPADAPVVRQNSVRGRLRQMQYSSRVSQAARARDGNDRSQIAHLQLSGKLTGKTIDGAHLLPADLRPAC